MRVPILCKQIAFSFFLAILVASCAPSSEPSPETLLPSAIPTRAPALTIQLTATLIPRSTPSPTPLASPTAMFDAKTRLGKFAQLAGNLANGEPAPDFTARVMGGKTFTLSQQRGLPVLLFPTVNGCGDCESLLQGIGAAYPEFRGRGLRVVILNLYYNDPPEAWEQTAQYYRERDFSWGVSPPTFAKEYKITNLGTVLLIDRKGDIVFRNKFPLWWDNFKQLFALATE